MTTESTGDSVSTVVLLVLAIVVLAPMLMMGLGVPMMGMVGMWGTTGVAPVWMVGMGLVWLLVFVGIGYLVYRALAGGTASRTDSALEELRLAYARGDLSDEEFENRREKLTREN